MKTSSIWHLRPVRLPLLLLTLILSAVLSSCAVMPVTRTPVPAELASLALVPATSGEAPIRYWGDLQDASEGAETIEVAIARQLPEIVRGKDLNFLSLSGGGFNGAFGTGFLTGWTARGDRPEFQIVTGISVGALIAPFAFLGSAYDRQLLDSFNAVTAGSRRSSASLGVLFGAPSLTTSKPIEQAIASIITPQALAAIAIAHKNGRRLLIGTTNLDAERPVVWDIGAIALSAIPDKVILVRKIILASTAVPGIYPPVTFDVVANGKAYTELHVDGGVTQQMVLVPNRRYGEELKQHIDARIYVIYNGQTSPSYEPVRASAFDIVARTVPTFIKYLGRADIERLREVAETNNAEFFVTAIPSDYETVDEFPPGKDYVQRLFKLGQDMGKAGAWQK